MKAKSTKPSDVSKDEEVELWERRIQLAEAKLKNKSGDMRAKGDASKGWKELINFYKGKQWQKGQGGKEKTFDRITANQAKSNIDSIRPQLYFQNPRIQVSVKNPFVAEQDIPAMGPDGKPVMQPGPPDPMTGMPTPVPVIQFPKGTPLAKVGGQLVNAQEQADLQQAIDNYVFTEVGARAIIRRIINDALIMPYGVARWEWKREMGPEEEKDAQGQPTGKQIDVVVRQYAELKRIKPWCFIWDTELDEFDIDSAEWYAEIKFLSKEDIEADKNLTNTESLPDPEYYVGEDEREFRNESDKREDMARYKVYDIHDLKHGKYMVWIEGSEKFNRVDDPSKYNMVEGGIYTVLGFNDVPDDSFPESTIDQIKSKAQAYNKILSYQVNHVGRFNRKYKHLKGCFKDENELEKWERGEDGASVEVQGMDMGPEPITDAPITTDVYNIASILKREITEDIGVSAYNRASKEQGVDTAFEANLIQGGADIKIQEKRDIVRQFCIDLVRKLNQILHAHADIADVVKITGDKGEKWVKWTNEDIKGEYIVDVDIYSSMPFSEEVEKKQAMELFSIAGADPYFNPLKVRRQLLRVFKWPEDILYSETEIQQQQQMQMMQQQQAQAQEAQRQQSANIRPTSGGPRTTVNNGPDMKGAISGQARNLQ